MPNMNYCRFHNTKSDLRECLENWDSPKSFNERKERVRLFLLCKEVVESFDEQELLDDLKAESEKRP